MMKYTKVFLALNLLFTSLVVRAAEELPARCLPEPEDDEDPLCVEEDGVCTNAEDTCCEGLACHGYGFYKKCIEPPVCLPKWHDCKDMPICCDGLKCILKENDAAECDVEEIGTRTIELPPVEGNSVETSAPSPAPPNLITTHPEDDSEVTYNIACSSGDPHIRTFDGEKYDCQADGEVILVKSWLTGREVQARYEHMTSSKAISVGKGIAMRDEGDVPLIEISVAQNDETVGNMMDDGCTLLFYVNGIQHDLMLGYEDEDVVVEVGSGHKFIITYKKTGFSATASYFKCRFNLCVTLPETDPTYGILGTSNQNATDEWTLVDESFIPIPTDRSDKLKKPGYDFCATHMCLRDESLSMFTHKEDGADFDFFNNCDLPYGDTFEEFIEDVPMWVIDVCGHDMSCIMDVRNGDEEDARMLRLARLEYAAVCNPTGGECEDSPCCEGSECIQFGALAGATCDGDMTCSPDMGSCENLDCCDGLHCVELNDGTKQCRKDFLCQEGWMSCGDGKECCDGLACFDNQVKGVKQCRKLPSCMKSMDDCSTIPCCGSLKCVEIANGAKQCQNIPDCWNRQWKDCSKAPCCDGLTCIRHTDGRDVCRKLPSCAKLGRSCEYIPPCESDKGPVECAEVVDAHGNVGKLARLIPGDVVVKVWDDLNADGIQDDNEPGIEGVKLAVVLSKKDSPIVSSEETTGADGVVTFKAMDKGKKYKIEVLEAPAGAIPTKRRNKEADPDKDSNLHNSGFSDSFFQTGPVYTGTSLGYRLPAAVEITIFADANSDGIYDDDVEAGIAGVHVKLVENNKETYLEDNGAGNAHEEVITGSDGIARFTGVPQNKWLRAEVVKKPDGAIPTHRNKGDNEDEDSELNSDGFSDKFRISGGDGLYHTTDLGYRLPETLIVRVWDDVDRDGIQDHGEPGMSGVTLRLVNNDKTPVEDFHNGGNAHTTLATDSDGMATFTRVPQNRWFKVEVVDKPSGAVPTVRNAGDDEALDSDLDSGFFTDKFRIETEGAYVNRDIGLALPGSLQVRVWDDENSDGIQDDSEPGIAGVQLQLVKSDRVTTLEDQGGNSHLPLLTDADGYVTFTNIPQNVWVRAKVLNGPEGATATSKGKGNDPEEDSNLEYSAAHGFMSSAVRLSEAGEITNIDLGYRLPETVRVRVWDDANQNGIMDDDEEGIQGAELKLVNQNKQDIPPTGVGNANEILITDEDGYVEFTGVNKANWHRVQVMNPPDGASHTTRVNNVDEETNSDLESVSYSKKFRLQSFTGSVYNDIKLGYMLAEDLTIRVWDDVNGDGVQDAGEGGLEGLVVKLTDKNKNDYPVVLEGSNAHLNLTTDADGMVRFVKVDKKLQIRVHVFAPEGSIATGRDKGGDDELDSELSSDFYAGPYRLSKWLVEGPMENIDLGLRLPLDFKIFVWEDDNGNGLQDEGEPPLEGVQIQLFKKDKVTPLDNAGGGSDAHLPKTTLADGFATFVKVPRNVEFRAVVLNPPPGSIATKRNAGGNSGDESDSELAYDKNLNLFYSDSVRLTRITTAGVVGTLDLGMKMPKTVIARVWIDANNNGIQDDDEDGFEGLQLQLVDKNSREPIPAVEGGTAADVLPTDTGGRVYFTRVPQDKNIRVKIVDPPEGYKAAKKNKGGDDQLDSELNSDFMTDNFKLPANSDDFYDLRDCGLVPL